MEAVAGTEAWAEAVGVVHLPEEGLASPNPKPKPGRRSRPTCLRKLQSGLALRRRQRLRQGGGGGWGIHYLPEEVGDQVDCALVLQVPRHQVGRLVVSKEVVRTK